MIEAAMLWNEPNNQSHWDFISVDPDWQLFSRMTIAASYYRHFHMGLVREDGTNKPAYEAFAAVARGGGICQWFHFEDARLDDAVVRLRELGVRHVRTGLSWADSLRPDADRWFDRLMRALDDFDARFCRQMISRYAPARSASPARDATRATVRA
jgi:beta-xylosidase